MIVRSGCWFVCTIFKRVVKVGLAEKVTFEQRLGGVD